MPVVIGTLLHSLLLQLEQRNFGATSVFGPILVGYVSTSYNHGGALGFARAQHVPFPYNVHAAYIFGDAFLFVPLPLSAVE